MFAEYIAAALEKAEYEIIDDPEPYYRMFRDCKECGLPAKPLRNAAKNSLALLRAGLSWDFAWGSQFHRL